MKNITVRAEGSVLCRSCFYTAWDGVLGDAPYIFSAGANKLIGEIDSGIWAASYLLSMYKHQPKDFILHGRPEIELNGRFVSLETMSDICCYMDRLYPMFSGKSLVKTMVSRELKKSKSALTPEEVAEMFQIDSERFGRPIAGMGNEKFKAMAAVGFCAGKEIFCFPWMSKKRFDGYHRHLSWLVEKLPDLGKIVVLPIGL